MKTRRAFLASTAAAAALAALPRQARAAIGDAATAGGVAKFEPAQGCYIGAFIERDTNVNGNIAAFEDLTKKKHASYFTYVGYGRPFPSEWFDKVARQGAAPHIAFEPNEGLQEVRDDAYLRAWARDAARTKKPIFLRWASEMNGLWGKKRYGGGIKKDEEYIALYKEKFALVARVMKQEAPNVAMVWTPFAEPARLIPDFYPGDEWVDWVGVNIYSVFVHNGDPAQVAMNEDPVDFLKNIYGLFGERKPIHVSEYAATIWCKGVGSETVEWAIEKTKRFYGALRDDFPRVKSVNWFCLDTVQAGLADNNYSLLADGRMLATYRQLVADPHFLSRVYYNPNEWNVPIKAGTTLGQNGLILRGPDASEDILATNGAIAATITEPFLRGLKNGDVISSDLELWAQLPLGMEARGLIWQVDGQNHRHQKHPTVPRHRAARAFSRRPAHRASHRADAKRHARGLFDGDVYHRVRRRGCKSRRLNCDKAEQGEIIMAVLTDGKTEQLFDQLMRIDGKAEIINGSIVHQMPTGKEPGFGALQIVMSLHLHARQTGIGRAVGDNVIFRVDLPNRKSFSPDAAYTLEARDGSMGAINSTPVFAVEVRSENDYGPSAERAIVAKIEEYFAAGTLAVWDVDLQSADVVTLHLPEQAPQIFRRGDSSHAGAALPGWTMEVDEIFA